MLEILLIMGALSGGANKESSPESKPKTNQVKSQEVTLDKKVKK